MDFINAENVSIIIFFIGLYGLITQKSIVKSIISIGILETAVILFYTNINFKKGSIPPIGAIDLKNFADPVPQALMITAIVIGVGVTAISLTMFMHFKQKYSSTYWPTKRREVN